MHRFSSRSLKVNDYSITGYCSRPIMMVSHPRTSVSAELKIARNCPDSSRNIKVIEINLICDCRYKSIIIQNEYAAKWLLLHVIVVA